MFEAPICEVAPFAPLAWVQDVMPSAFNAWDWFWSSFNNPLDLERWPRFWSWKAALPSGAEVDVHLGLTDDPNKLRVSAQLHRRHSEGGRLHLVCVHGSIRREHRALRVLWMGRSQGLPAHCSIRGHAAYVVSHPRMGTDAEQPGKEARDCRCCPAWLSGCCRTLAWR